MDASLSDIIALLKVLEQICVYIAVSRAAGNMVLSPLYMSALII